MMLLRVVALAAGAAAHPHHLRGGCPAPLKNEIKLMAYKAPASQCQSFTAERNMRDLLAHPRRTCGKNNRRHLSCGLFNRHNIWPCVKFAKRQCKKAAAAAHCPRTIKDELKLLARTSSPGKCRGLTSGRDLKQMLARPRKTCRRSYGRQLTCRLLDRRNINSCMDYAKKQCDRQANSYKCPAQIKRELTSMAKSARPIQCHRFTADRGLLEHPRWTCKQRFGKNLSCWLFTRRNIDACMKHAKTECRDQCPRPLRRSAVKAARTMGRAACKWFLWFTSSPRSLWALRSECRRQAKKYRGSGHCNFLTKGNMNACSQETGRLCKQFYRL